MNTAYEDPNDNIHKCIRDHPFIKECARTLEIEPLQPLKHAYQNPRHYIHKCVFQTSLTKSLESHFDNLRLSIDGNTDLIEGNRTVIMGKIDNVETNLSSLFGEQSGSAEAVSTSHAQEFEEAVPVVPVPAAVPADMERALSAPAVNPACEDEEFFFSESENKCLNKNEEGIWEDFVDCETEKGQDGACSLDILQKHCRRTCAADE